MRNAAPDIPQLLGEDFVEQDAVGFDEIADGFAAVARRRARSVQAGRGRTVPYAVLDGENPGRREDRHDAVALGVEAALLQPEPPEHAERRGEVHGVGAERDLEGPRIGRHVEGLAVQSFAEAGIAVNGDAVEEDVAIQDILRQRAPDPSAHLCAPAFEVHAPLGVPGHDAALAVGNPGGVQNVRQPPPELLEPPVLGSARSAGLVNDGVVLVHGEQAFPASARAENQDGERHGRRSEPFGLHVAFGQCASAPRERAKLARDHRRDDARIDFVRSEPADDPRQVRPHLAEIGRRFRMVDFSRKEHRVARALLQQVAGADSPDEAAVIRHDAEMPEAADRHQRVRAVEKFGSGDGHQRPRGEPVHRFVQRGGAQRIDGPRDVPLGQDADAGFRLR